MEFSANTNSGPVLPPASPINISDVSALKAIERGASNIEVPLTYNPYRHSPMRRKSFYPSAPAIPAPLSVFSDMPAGPLVAHSLSMLSPFASFGDDSGDTSVTDAASVSDSGFWDSLLGAVPTLTTGAANILTATQGRVSSLPTGSVQVSGASAAPQQRPPVNWLPIVLIGGGLIFGAIYLSKKR